MQFHTTWFIFTLTFYSHTLHCSWISEYSGTRTLKPRGEDNLFLKEEQMCVCCLCLCVLLAESKTQSLNVLADFSKWNLNLPRMQITACVLSAQAPSQCVANVSQTRCHYEKSLWCIMTNSCDLSQVISRRKWGSVSKDVSPPMTWCFF